MELRLSRRAKDHVLVDMFNQPKYCLELFNVLHLEAKGIAEADIRNITISYMVVINLVMTKNTEKSALL